MRYISHVATGITTGVLLAPVADVHPLIAVGFSVLGAVLPDIDSGSSKVSKKLIVIKSWRTHKGLRRYFWFVLPLLLALFFSSGSILLLLLAATSYLLAVSTHRSVFHSLFAVLLWSAILIATGLENRYISLVVLNYLLHLLLDMTTPRGVPLLAPFVKKRFKLPLTLSSSSEGIGLYELAYLALNGAIVYRSLLP